MNPFRAFTFFMVISITLMLLHFAIMYVISVDDVPVLLSIYGFSFLLGMPIFVTYVYIQQKFINYLGSAYIVFNIIKSVILVASILYLINILSLDVETAFLNYMISFLIFTIAELVPLFKLMNVEIEEDIN